MIPDTDTVEDPWTMTRSVLGTRCQHVCKIGDSLIMLGNTSVAFAAMLAS